MSEGRAKYACDDCRFRKAKCSRDKPRCQQCAIRSIECVYSRSGIIRRRTRQSTRQGQSAVETRDEDRSIHISARSRPLSDSPQPQIVSDINTARQDLEKSFQNNTVPIEALSSLNSEYTAFWPGDDADQIGPEDKTLIAFHGDLAASLTRAYVAVLAKGEPFFTTTPPEILDKLASDPESIRENARLVIFYGILFTEACQNRDYDDTLRRELRWNLRLALDDARLMLEPTDINIQALCMLATHVQDLTSPSLCWMLVSSACRMLLSLRSNVKAIGPLDRKVDLFWSLASLDMSLAIIFGRAPTFRRGMYKHWPMMPFERLLRYQPHVPTIQLGCYDDPTTSDGADPPRSLFGAHFMRCSHQLVYVMADIWYFLYEDIGSVRVVKAKLDNWYKESTEVLEATTLAEDPMLDKPAAKAVQLGLYSNRFQYHYFAVILIRGQEGWKKECIEHSREAMLALDGLASDSTDVFNGIVWQILFCPFTPFLVLLGDVLSEDATMPKTRSLQAMFRLPEFLTVMIPRHPQAAKLQAISSAIAQHASQLHAESQKGVPSQASDLQNKADQDVAAVGPRQASGNEPNQENAANSLSEIQPAATWDAFLSDTGLQDLPLQFPSQQMPGIGQANFNFADFPVELASAPAAIDISQAYDMFAQSNFDWLDWNYQTGPSDML